MQMRIGYAIDWFAASEDKMSGLLNRTGGSDPASVFNALFTKQNSVVLWSRNFLEFIFLPPQSRVIPVIG